MDKNAMIAKIAALMAKANGTDNEHESDAFFKKAEELMAKHGVNADDLDTDKIVHVGADFTIAADLIWQNRLVWALARYFGTVAVQSRNFKVVSFQIVGRESDRITVNLMFPYLIAEVKRKARELVAVNGKSVGSNTRDIGIALAIRLDEEAPEEPKDIRKYIDDGMKTSSIKQSRTKISQGAVNAAKSINMNRQVNTAKKAKAIAR